MTDTKELLAQVQHVKAFLASAEAALSAPGRATDSKVDAARVGIESAGAAMPGLLEALSGFKAG